MSKRNDQHRGVWHVQATRSGPWWAITCDALPGLHSQAKRYREVEGMARDAIALLLDVDPDEVTVVPEAVLPSDLHDQVAERRELIHTMEHAQRAVAVKSVEVLRGMADLGLSQRDAADVLGVSFQRVSQLWPQHAVKEG